MLTAVRAAGIACLDCDRVLTDDLAAAATPVRDGVPVSRAEATLAAPWSP